MREETSIDHRSAIAAIQHYESNPVDHIQEVQKAFLDPWQKDVAKALSDKHFVGIRSGSGVGKTFLLARLILWFLTTKPFCKVPCTAPSQHQLHDLLWGECYRQIKSSPYLDSMLSWTQTRIGVKGYEPSWFAAAQTAGVSPSGEVSEGLSGYHAEDNLLFVLDETSGIKKQVFPAVEGALTGRNAYCIFASNPTRDQGYFYDIFNSPKVGNRFAKFHISCLDSPRVTDDYIQMMLDKYGEDHPVYRFKVLGEFPFKTDDYLIPGSYIEAMQNTSKETRLSPLMPIEIGVDLGRAKASSIAFVRQGFNILATREFRRTGGIDDVQNLFIWCSNLIQEFRPSVLRIDAIFMPGVYDLLHAVYPKIVISVIGSAKAEESDKYINLRAEGCWTLRDLVPKIWCQSWPDRLITEMGNIKKKSSPTGKLGVESKQEMIRRSMVSPDHFDAMWYAFLGEVRGEIIQTIPFPKMIIPINEGLESESSFLSHQPYKNKWDRAFRQSFN